MVGFKTDTKRKPEVSWGGLLETHPENEGNSRHGKGSQLVLASTAEVVQYCMVNGQRLSYVQFRWIAEAWTGGETHATHVTEYHTNKHERVCGIQRALMLVQINR